MSPQTPQSFIELFFVAPSPIGRRLPEKLGQNRKPITGPWRDTRRVDGKAETDDRAITPEMVKGHIDGTLLQSGQVAQLMPYLVDGQGFAVATAIDLDSEEGGHTKAPEHFVTHADARHAACALNEIAQGLGLRLFIETTKSGGSRVWLFSDRLQAADAHDLGRLLLVRAGLHPKIEVFPKQGKAGVTGNGVFLPYWGKAAPGRTVILDPATGEYLDADEFARLALSQRNAPEKITRLVEAARAGHELPERAVARKTQTNGEPVAIEGPDGAAAQAWAFQVSKCAYLRGLVERAESGAELTYDSWVHGLGTHLRKYGRWGRQEFHRLSAFDGRYDEIETDNKLDSLTGGPQRCDTTGCDRSPAECGLPPNKVSPIYWGFAENRRRRNMTALPMVAPTSADDQPQATTDQGDEWELPIPFGAEALPTFPLEALPEGPRRFVAEVAESRQVPVDMAAMMWLTTTAAAGARRCEVRIGNTHTEPLNLYVAVVMPPGSRKSGTQEDFAEPLREYEEHESQLRYGDWLRDKEKAKQETRRLETLRDKIAREKNEMERRAMEDEAEGLAVSPTEPQELPRLLADDVTMERLAGLLAEQEDNCIGILSAEGGIFGILAGRYSNGAVNLDLLLKGHGGETYRVDRVNQAPKFIRRPTITIGLAVQPDVLESLADNASFRGRGLLGRFLYSIPESLVGTRIYQNRGVDKSAKDDYRVLMMRLLNLRSAATKENPGARHTLQLQGAALSIWKTYYDHIERQQVEGEPLAAIQDWASKLAGAVARIAGSLHLVIHSEDISPWDKPLEPETVAAAWAIGEYLIPHARAAFGQMGADPARELATRLLRWIARKELSEFKFADCLRAHQNVTTGDKLEIALALLCEHGYLRIEEQRLESVKGRPPKARYAVNPALKKDANN